MPALSSSSQSSTRLLWSYLFHSILTGLPTCMPTKALGLPTPAWLKALRHRFNLSFFYSGDSLNFIWVFLKMSPSSRFFSSSYALFAASCSCFFFLSESLWASKRSLRSSRDSPPEPAAADWGWVILAGCALATGPSIISSTGPYLPA